MEALNNFLSFLYNNWIGIITCILFIIGIIKKTMDFFKKSDAEKLEIIKAQIKETILKDVSDAEKEYNQWISAGEIKRSQVIQKIFEKHPELARLASQEEIIAFIDDAINEALEVLREIIAENEATFVIKTEEAH